MTKATGNRRVIYGTDLPLPFLLLIEPAAREISPFDSNYSSFRFLDARGDENQIINLKLDFHEGYTHVLPIKGERGTFHTIEGSKPNF